MENVNYRVQADQFNRKTLLRIAINSNQGKISTFDLENGDPCAFIRLNW